MFTKILTSSLLFLIAIGGFFVSIDIDTSTIGSSIAITSISEVGAADDPNLGKNAPDKSPSTTTESQSKWLNDTIELFNALLGFITVLVSPAIILASWLMSPDWTSGDLFGLREPMHKMWVIVSNIVYFIYAILLIIIALATIFGKENFSYKTMIPRLALGILMVPFTWWFVQWTISLAAVVTAQVVSIPLEALGKTTAGNKYLDKPVIPKTYLVKTSENTKGEISSQSSSTDCSKGTNCTSVRQMLETGGGMYSSLMMYAYDVFKLQEAKEIKSTLDAVKTAGQLLNQLILGAVMFFVFGLLVLALIAMLLIRAIKLWMYAIFSPIFTLHFVAGKELFGKGTEGFDIKEFIGLCFIPAVVGLVLSFGLMIVAVVREPNNEAPKTCDSTKIEISYADSSILSDGTVSGGCDVITLFGNKDNKIIRGVKKVDNQEYTVNVIKVAGLTYIYEGKAKNNIDTTVADVNTTRGGLDAAGGIFGTIIIDIIALVFIWMAFMAAKGITKAVDAAVEPFEAMGKKIGGMAMSAPKYIPIPGTGGQSAASLQRTVELGANKIQEMKNIDSNAKAGKLVPWAVEGIIKPEDETKIKNAIRDAAATKIQPALRALGNGVDKANDSKINLEKMEGFAKDIYAKTGNNESIFKSQLRDVGIDISSTEAKALIKVAQGNAVDDNERRLALTALKSMKGSGGKGETPTGGTIIPKTESGKITEITINNNGSHVWQGKDLIPSNIDKIAEQLKGSGIQKEKLDEVLKGTGLEGKTDELLNKIKEIEEKK